MNAYFLCGLKVASKVDFPELQPWRGDPAKPADVEFAIGPIEPLATPDQVGERFQAQGDSAFILEVPRVGRVKVTDGARIVFEPEEGADPLRVRLNLIGTVQSVLWHQRGLLPLHASAVRVDQRAVALAGPPRAGKSVLTAALTQVGCDLLADDFVVLDYRTAPPRVLPGYQRLRLWDDACEVLGLQSGKLARAHPVYDKFVVEGGASTTETPMPLSDLLILGPRSTAFGLERLAAPAAIQNLLAVVHTPEAVQALGRQKQVSDGFGALLAAGVRVWRLSVSDDLADAPAMARQLLAAMTS